MRLAILIAAVSAAVLGYEVALMRTLSVARWHHFAYMVVSVALLGFGASGTFLSLWGRRLAARFEGVTLGLAVAFALALPLSFMAAQLIPFDVFQLTWDWRQSLRLLATALVLLVPFLLGATCIGLAFVRETARAHSLYFWNLAGSGVGAGGVVGLMFVLPPAQLPLAAFAVAGAGAVVFAAPLRRRLVAGGGLALALAFSVVVAPLRLEVSEHKPLRGLLDAGARVADVRESPLGTVHVLEGTMIHLVAGRSLAFVGEEPQQRALVTDAGSVSAIVRAEQREQARALDYTTAALPYHLLKRPRTLIVGAGGGADVVLARYDHAASVTALEVNPAVVALMRGSQAEFSQRIYEQPGVDVVPAEARGHLAAARGRYDLVQLPLAGPFAAAGAGVYALHESTLCTVEAVQAGLDALADGGILCVTRWMDAPPRDAIRVFATVTEALGLRVVADVSRHVVFIRGWSTATILASPTPFTDAQLAAVRAFCRERAFDLVWVPGMREDEANSCHALPQPYYADAARALLSGRRALFLDAYAFDITPTTDDRPYHGLMLRWRALAHLRATMGPDWVRNVDWGYLVLLITLAAAIAAGAVLVLFPLLLLRRADGPHEGRMAVGIYFSCLGVAFMFIEIMMIHRLTLFLASPIYAAAVVLASFMVCSGLGSLAAGRLFADERRAIACGAGGIVVLGLLAWLGLDPLLRVLWPYPLGVRLATTAACAGGLAFFMGMPFPSGLRLLARGQPSLTPWAWGVNGCASVVGATLATVLAVSWGFRAVLLVALGLYTLASLAVQGIAPPSLRPAQDGPST